MSLITVLNCGMGGSGLTRCCSSLPGCARSAVGAPERAALGRRGSIYAGSDPRCSSAYYPALSPRTPATSSRCLRIVGVVVLAYGQLIG
jgi:hypothetical protein